MTALSDKNQKQLDFDSETTTASEAENNLNFAVPPEHTEKKRMLRRENENLPQSANSISPLRAKAINIDRLEGRFYVTHDDGVVNADKREIVARSGSKVNALGGKVVAEDGADVRGAFGSYIEFLPGSKGIIEAGTDVKLWPGAVVKVVQHVKPFLH